MEHPIPEPPPPILIPFWFYPVVVVIVLVILATKMPRYKSLFAKISFTVFLATIGLILGLGYFKGFPGMICGLAIGITAGIVFSMVIPMVSLKANKVVINVLIIASPTVGAFIGLAYFKGFPGMVSGLMIGLIPSLILGKLLPSRREKNNQNQR